ncbi:hypothetical protein [Brucella anthropi]|uniref:hypothetical protein n=1 Tax=Brucella anthropi TaxID=529 RepID=UPI001184E5C2|nr:hypothetical protein [Brucella anthropi]KAB2737112.1 hypothetical protein F9K90_10815 [Brucella anthropi]KAB2753075.1 hypothetical protein F9K95_11245 [Brucella anthropi]KAB2779260.1 hypothetical protein F9K99_13095 [Brucella anthropi]QQC24970.1 hypothetical protein I6H96_12380 [Brucella anthropi]
MIENEIARPPEMAAGNLFHTVFIERGKCLCQASLKRNRTESHFAIPCGLDWNSPDGSTQRFQLKTESLNRCKYLFRRIIQRIEAR